LLYAGKTLAEVAGYDDSQAEQAWKKWRGENPKYGVGGEG
jgi:hypothetical protein